MRINSGLTSAKLINIRPGRSKASGARWAWSWKAKLLVPRPGGIHRAVEFNIDDFTDA
jgi:hypothetical protein